MPSAPRQPHRLATLARAPLAIARSTARALPAAVEGFFRHRLPQQAAGIAYRVLFSLAPLSIVLVSVFGAVLKDDELRADVIDRIVGWLPVTADGESSVEEAITRLASPSGVFGIVSLGVFAWASTGMMGAVRAGLEVAFEVDQRRPVVRGKLVDLALVASAGMLVLVSIGIAFAAQVALRVVRGATDTVGAGVGGELVKILVPLAIVTVVVVLIYRFVPARPVELGDAIAGGIVTGLLFLAISAGSALIYDRVSDLSVVYGSITVVLVFLYSVYLYASALLFGAEFAAAWSRTQPAGPRVPLVERVRGALKGLVVAPAQPVAPGAEDDPEVHRRRTQPDE